MLGGGTIEYYALLILGTALILAELFVPGGIVGTMGAILVFFSLWKLTNSVAELLLFVAIFVGCISILIFILLKIVPKDKLNNTLFLKRELNKDSGFISSVNYENLIGQHGITVTVLRPVGKIKISDNIYNATSEDKFIDKDKEIIVTGAEGANIIIKEV